ncbi:MAG: TIM barrel protein [Fimbriimonadaceae bacterium]
MRIGICGGPEVARPAIDAGFDYVELPVQLLRGTSDDFDAAPYADLNWESANLFFPGSFRIYGPDADDWRRYARRVAERAARLGIRVLVLGGGGIRRAPAGVEPAAAEAEFVETAATLHSIAWEFGVAVAPESLNRTETDVGNSLPDLAAALAAKGTPYTADAYHVLREWDLGGRHGDPSAPEFWRSQIPHAPAHCHLADRTRNLPSLDDPPILAFLRRLVELGYDRRVSLEAPVGDTPLADVARRMRELVAAAERD